MAAGEDRRRVTRGTIVAGLCLFIAGPALAQLTPDTSMPGENSSLQLNVDVRGGPATLIQGGAMRGSNLFHSFLQFNVAEGDRVYFANPAGITSIFSRVTGGNPSNILGTLGVNGIANLFLLNPNGILFGRNAQLDVGGSVVVSTASALQFGQQGVFSAVQPESPGLLTVNPSALLFNQLNAGRIENRSAVPTGSYEGVPLFGLQIQSGRSLLMVGSEVVFDGGGTDFLGQETQGGRVELAAVTGTGAVGLNFENNLFRLSVPPEMGRGDVILTNASRLSTATFFFGGDVQVWGRNVRFLNGSEIFTNQMRSFLIGPDLGASGTVTIDASDSVQMAGLGPFFNVINGIRADADTQKASTSIRIDTRSLIMQDRSRISASIYRGGEGGNISINATERVFLSGMGDFSPSVEIGASGLGNSGDVSIRTHELFMQGQANIRTSSNRRSGRVTIDASESVSLIGRNPVQPNSSKLTNISTMAFSATDAGAIAINTKRLLLEDAASIETENFSDGISGSMMINASESVRLVNTNDSRVNTYPVLSTVYSASLGRSGDLTINTQDLSLENGSRISTNRGGNLTINASNSVRLSGTFLPADADAIFQLTIPFASSLTSTASLRGDAGNIVINTRELWVRDGGQIQSDTALSRGSAGQITIRATERVDLAGVSASGTPTILSALTLTSVLDFRDITGSQTSPLLPSTTGQGGTVDIVTRQLLVRDRAVISTETQSLGDAGNLTVTANQVEISGGGQVRSSTTFSGEAGDIHLQVNDSLALSGAGSGLLANTQPGSTGNGGSILVQANRLQMGDRALISAEALGNGSAGNLEITANQVELNTGAQIRTSTAGSQDAGDISLQVGDRLTLSGDDTALLANTQPGSTGNGGNIAIQAGRTIVRDGARIAVDSQGSGAGGDLQITTGYLTLDNRARLVAETASSQGGNISLQIGRLLLLRRNSQISTTAGNAQAGGDGGNITIAAPFIVSAPNENSDITANAFSGRGGRITITARGIFWLVFRSRAELERLLGPGRFDPRLLASNDITAFSQTNASLSGLVTINAPDTDNAQGFVELPGDLVDVAQLVEQSLCKAGEGSQFIVTGRGGLPDAASEVLHPEAVWEDWRIGAGKGRWGGEREMGRFGQDEEKPIVEAQGWLKTANGEVLLTADPIATLPYQPWLTVPNCRLTAALEGKHP